MRPVRAKVLNYKTFALTGRIVQPAYTQGDALGYVAHWAFSPHCLSSVYVALWTLPFRFAPVIFNSARIANLQFM